MSFGMGPSDWVLANRCDVWPEVQSQDADGGVVFSYPVPSVTGEACSAQPVQTTEDLENERMTRQVLWEVMFGRHISAMNRAKLVITVPDGAQHIAFVEAQQDQAGRGTAYVVYAIEKL